MKSTKRLLFVLSLLVAFLGLGIIVLAAIGDSSVVAATAGVYGALEKAGLQNEIALRRELYEVVLRLKGPWVIVQWSGIAVLVSGLVGAVGVTRSR